MSPRSSPNLLYISTNLMWSGSEELWTRSAKGLQKKGYSVSIATPFAHAELDKLKARHLLLSNPSLPRPVFAKVMGKITGFVSGTNHRLKSFINAVKPALVIVSQGNNYDSLPVMQCCYTLGVPYVTVTQLVGEVFVGAFQNDRLPLLQQSYLTAQKNYFVSHHNLQLNNLLLGLELPNAETVYNPCKLDESDISLFPNENDKYAIGLVGRIECWQKGYDLLIQIADQQKWKKRPVLFNVYGDGPNAEVLKANIRQKNLSNLVLKGYAKHVADVWKDNQLLLMPSRMEGQALALIEAMWCERAAVVTDVGGAAELIEEGYSGFIAGAPTVDAVEAALERAWQQRNHWKEMGLNAAAGLKTKYPADAVAYFNEQILKQLPG